MNLTRCSNALNTTVSTPNTAKNSFRKLCAWLFSSYAFFQRFENAVAALRISFHDFTASSISKQHCFCKNSPGRVAIHCDRLFGRNKLRPSHGELPSGRRTAVERRPYRTIRNVPLRGATGSSQTESMEM